MVKLWLFCAITTSMSLIATACYIWVADRRRAKSTESSAGNRPAIWSRPAGYFFSVGTAASLPDAPVCAYWATTLLN